MPANRTPPTTAGGTPGIQSQITTYVYGGTGILGNDDLRQMIFPGGTSESVTRNHLGEVVTKTQRDGSVHNVPTALCSCGGPPRL
jgi:hypothetical protein